MENNITGPQLADRTHFNDFVDLILPAKSALQQALHDGEEKGFLPGDWLEHSADDHLKHARDHIRAITRNTTSAMGREDISHAICRLIMTWAKLEKD